MRIGTEGAWFEQQSQVGVATHCALGSAGSNGYAGDPALRAIADVPEVRNEVRGVPQGSLVVARPKTRRKLPPPIFPISSGVKPVFNMASTTT